MKDVYTKLLHTSGYRVTPQRLAILQILQEPGRHLTPLEIYQEAQRTIPGLTEATVYRTLNFLSEQGLILAAHIGSGQLVYESAEHSHHHLICRKCGNNHPIEHDLLKPLYEQFLKSTGYQIDTIHATFFGLCPSCQINKPTQLNLEDN